MTTIKMKAFLFVTGKNLSVIFKYDKNSLFSSLIISVSDTVPYLWLVLHKIFDIEYQSWLGPRRSSSLVLLKYF